MQFCHLSGKNRKYPALVNSITIILQSLQKSLFLSFPESLSCSISSLVGVISIYPVGPMLSCSMFLHAWENLWIEVKLILLKIPFLVGPINVNLDGNYGISDIVVFVPAVLLKNKLGGDSKIPCANIRPCDANYHLFLYFIFGSFLMN